MTVCFYILILCALVFCSGFIYQILLKRLNIIQLLQRRNNRFKVCAAQNRAPLRRRGGQDDETANQKGDRATCIFLKSL